MNEIKQYDDNNFNDKYKYLLDKNILKLDTDDNIKKENVDLVMFLEYLI